MLGPGPREGWRGWHGGGLCLTAAQRPLPGAGRSAGGPALCESHMKYSGEEGLSLVEPASLKPVPASFSHLIL